MPPYIEQGLRGRLFNSFWGDGMMVYPIQLRRENQVGVLVVNLYALVCVFLSFPPIFVLNKVFIYFFIIIIILF